jgi:Ala-tRNA(Pro) deacylase
MITEIEQRVYDTLNSLGISYVRYEHEPVFTMEDLEKVGIKDAMHCKNLFTRNRKGDEHYLIIVGSSKRVDLKTLSQQIGCTPLSFASEERLWQHIGLKTGAVSLFGLLNDPDKSVKVLIDQDLVGMDKLCMHPNVNTATIEISYHGLERFLDWSQNEVRYVRV